MLLVPSNDDTATIWNVSTSTTWPSRPHVILKGHSKPVSSVAFLGDESHVITGSADGSICIWRTSDGVQTAKYECGNKRTYEHHNMSHLFDGNCVFSLSYHAASGIISVGLSNGGVELWQTDPYIAPHAALRAALPAHTCVRKRLAEAQAQAKDVETSINNADSGLRQQMSREQELKRSIADLEFKCAYISNHVTIVLTCV